MNVSLQEHIVKTQNKYTYNEIHSNENGKSRMNIMSDLICASICTAIKDRHCVNNFVQEFDFNGSLYIHNYLFNTYSNNWKNQMLEDQYLVT